MNNLSQDTLEGKGKSRINFENLSFSFLKKTKSKHPKNLFFGHLNINLIRNKFESVQEIIQNTFDIFPFSETKIDSSFPSQQFSIPKYRIFRKDRNAHEGGLLFYVYQDLNCKVLTNHPMRQNFENLALELKFSRTNCLIINTCKPPPSLSDITFTPEIKNILTFYWSTHDNILLMGDFNMTLDNPNFNELIEDHQPSDLISEPTCFESINPTCIDNFLTSKKTCFMNTLTFETDVSNHHKHIGTMLRSTFVKDKSKKISYCRYKNFDNEKIEEKLKKQLPSVLDFESFIPVLKTTLDRFAPLKQKAVGNNNQPFMTKTLRKAIIKRSKLKNKFNQERNVKKWSDYKQHQNYCSNLLKEAKTHHFNNLNVKDVTENKRFWKTIKPIKQ